MFQQEDKVAGWCANQYSAPNGIVKAMCNPEADKKGREKGTDSEGHYQRVGRMHGGREVDISAGSYTDADGNRGVCRWKVTVSAIMLEQSCDVMLKKQASLRGGNPLTSTLVRGLDIMRNYGYCGFSPVGTIDLVSLESTFRLPVGAFR